MSVDSKLTIVVNKDSKIAGLILLFGFQFAIFLCTKKGCLRCFIICLTGDTSEASVFALSS